jgi:hypothetical protein
MSVLKKPNKTQKNRFEVGFFRRFFLGFIGRVFYCQPWIPVIRHRNAEKISWMYNAAESL